MLRRHLWLPILLAFVLAPPSAASADEAWQPFGLDIASADESADATVANAPVLDLSFEPATSDRPQGRPAALPARPASAVRAPTAPFSVGLDIKTRHEIGDEARQEAAAEPTLADEMAGMMRRSTFGLKGTYHF